jgi:hypothetical protein
MLVDWLEQQVIVQSTFGFLKPHFNAESTFSSYNLAYEFSYKVAVLLLTCGVVVAVRFLRNSFSGIFIYSFQMFFMNFQNQNSG